MQLSVLAGARAPAPAARARRASRKRAGLLPSTGADAAVLRPRGPRGAGRRGVRVQVASASSALGLSPDLSGNEGPPSTQDLPPKAVTLHYWSGWNPPTVHYSINGATWEIATMEVVDNAPGRWWCCHLPVVGAYSGEAPLLEFVITDGTGSWDKPAANRNYKVMDEEYSMCLKRGHLYPLGADKPAIMVVTDLDDTLIGDDEATAAFKSWWEDHAVLRGSKLVFNTGRPKDLLEQLMREKSGIMPLPDIAILSVGTQVYTNPNGGFHLVEDEKYARTMDTDWNLNAMQETAHRTIAAVGDHRMHLRPENEQNEHKVTMGVHLSVLDEVVEAFEDTLKRSGLKANVIVSGVGEWRFVDVVSSQAGKLSALRYVMHQGGFDPARTIACGDSGNDLLMMQGDHRAIVVGNAHHELMDWALNERRSLGSSSPTASGGNGAAPRKSANELSAMERIIITREHRARGIMEGLQTFGFL